MSSPAITGISPVDLSVTDLESSISWYTQLLGMVPLFGGRNDARGYDVQYLMEPDSGVVIGLEQHDTNPGTPFDERRVGLDHLGFNVDGREQLAADVPFHPAASRNRALRRRGAGRRVRACGRGTGSR